MAYATSEQSAEHFAARVRQAAPCWAIDIVQAYASVAVFLDISIVGFSAARDQLSAIAEQPAGQISRKRRRRHLIPCCYELGLDVDRICHHTGLNLEEMVRLHSGVVYTVYAIGFCPGFPYLGYMPEPLAGVPRLASPRLLVEAGSVGLTGRQTGIYTLPRPGGWNLVGKTPLELVSVADDYFPLRTGDKVQFVRIDASEFARRRGERLG